MEPLNLEGDIDSENADAVHVGLVAQLVRHGGLSDDHDEPIRIDCSRVTFFSSAALSMLLRFRSETDREIRLLDPSNEMRRSLEITGLDGMFLAP